MTKKDYILIAKILKDIKDNQHDIKYNNKDVWISIFTGSFAQELEKENPRFDKDKFYNAVWSK